MKYDKNRKFNIPYHTVHDGNIPEGRIDFMNSKTFKRRIRPCFTTIRKDGSRLTIYRIGKNKVRVVSRENDLSKPMTAFEKIETRRKLLIIGRDFRVPLNLSGIRRRRR